MSRYGFSLGREQSSPYSSQSGGVPNVTEADYDYITSQDLDAVDPAPASRRKPASPPVEDDVLLIKNKGITYPAHFPAYSIADGRLLVKDVRNRIGLMLEMSERKSHRIRLIYKGRQLKEPAAPVRDYRIKNTSEIMALVPDAGPDDSETEAEMVVVNDPGPSHVASPSPSDSKSRSKRRKKRSGKKTGERTDPDSASSPSTADGNRSPLPGEIGLRKLEELNDLYENKYLPMCEKFIAAPPTDEKKREDEHRKLSETVLQHILLKTDEVDTEGNPMVRQKRKALVKTAQELLKKLDVVKDNA